MYQYQDGEYMTADEYDEFVYNPSGFMLGKWAPRQFKSLEGFSQTIPWRRFMWSGWMNLYTKGKPGLIMDAADAG